jgi:hypothetical protein
MSTELTDVDLLMRSASGSTANSDIYSGWGNRRFDDVEEATASWVWPEGKHPFVVVGVEIKRGKPKEDENGITRQGQEYLLVTSRAIGGPNKDMELQTRPMLEGKGRPNFITLMAAVDLWDRESKTPLGIPADLIGKCYWAEVKTEKQEYPKGSGTFNPRSIIKYASFEHIDKYELPENAVIPDNGDLDEYFGEVSEPVAPVVEPEPEPVAATPKPRRVAAAGPGTTPPWH